VELLVVLAVIGMILGMSVPSLLSYSGQLRLKAATRQVVSLASLARSKAISSRENHALVVDQDAGEVYVVNQRSGERLEQVARMPRGLTIEVEIGGAAAPEPQVVFRPTGSLDGRTTALVLSMHERSHSVTVTGATGALAVD
jgi:Tfp pilus assembly protein FimT